MKINLVSQWFPPEPSGRIAQAYATGLAGLGHQVNVLTGFPNYPDGKVYSGYRIRPLQRESPSSKVEVYRTALYPSHSAKALPRAVNYTTWALSSAAAGSCILPRADVWLTYLSPATAGAAAALARPGRRAPHFVVIQDLWPDSVIDSAMISGKVGAGVERLLTRACRLLYRQATGIGVISPGMAEVLVSRGVPASKIHYTPNWDPGAPAQALDPAYQGLKEKCGIPTTGLAFLYAGNVGELQAIDRLAAAFAQCPGATLVIVGSGTMHAQVKAQVQQREWTNVQVRDAVSKDEVAELTRACDVQVVSLQDTPLLRATMPSKVQAALAAGRPILVHAAGDAATIVTQSGAGLAASPTRQADVCRAISQMVNMSSEDLATMGKAARVTYDDLFAAPQALARLEAMLQCH